MGMSYPTTRQDAVDHRLRPAEAEWLEKHPAIKAQIQAVRRDVSTRLRDIQGVTL